MAQLEIRRRSGAIETHPLDRKSPATIGSSSTADVCVDAHGVLAIECRVIWNGQAFVVNAVNPDGVPLNGTTVKKAVLSDADVVRVGDVDIVFVDEVPAGKGAAKGPPADEITMKSVGDEDRIDYTGSGMSDRNPIPGREGNVSERSARGSKSDRPRPAKTAEESSSRSGKERSAEPPIKPERPGRGTSGRSGDERPRKPSRELLDDDQDDGKEYAIPGLPADEPKGGRADMGSADPLAKVLAEVDPKEKRQKPVLSRGGGTVESQPEPRASLKDTLKSLIKSEPKRPGEQELHRSPLVVGMTVGAAVLLLTAGTLWFVLAREFMNRKYEAAQQQLDAGQYAQAIEGFTKFVAEYPRTEEAKKARVNIGKAQVEQSLSGALPDWENGLKTLNEFVNEHRDTEEFQSGTSLLRTFARDSANRIALGAAETARTAKRRPLLAVSSEARTLLDLLSPADDKPEERLAAIGAALRTAEAAILQQETFDAALARMKAAIDAGTPLDALRAYRQLLDRYAVARNDRTIQSQLKMALEADQKAVRRSESASTSVDGGTGPEVVASTLARRVRARTDVTSVGATTSAISEGAMFGVDTITGDTLWRRSVGIDTPFLPVSVQSSSPGWLAYDTSRKLLVCVKERTGEPLWSAALADRPTGPPLVHEGQIFLATEGSTLAQFDLQSGEHVATLQFAQPVIGPPAINSAGDRMYLAGRESTLYVLSRRPLACEHAIWLGQGAGAIRAPVLMLRDYLLLVENAGGERSIVRLFDTSRDPKAPREIATADMDGQVYDAPVVRGKQVVIASSPERLTAFVIAETGDAQSLTKVASYQVPGAQPGPMQILLGPDDQFWMSSTALRRFDVKVDSIVPDKQNIAVGETSQPMSAVADSLFLGRRLKFSRAVFLANADRQKMVVDWQSVLGATILEGTEPSASDGTALLVTSVGDVFQLNASKIGRGGVELQPSTTLMVDDKTPTPIGAARMKDGRVAVWSAGESPKLWIVSNEAAPRETKLDLPLQTAPARLADGLVLPLPGRLRLAARNANAAPAQEWTAPVQAAAAPVWKGIAAVNDTSLVALDGTGRLMLVQLRSNPKPHLAEVSKWDAGQPVDIPLAIAGDRAIVAASNGRVFALDTQSLEPVGQFDLPRPAARPAVIIGSRVLIDAGRETLVCLDSATQMNKQWELPLDGATVVGGIETDGRIILARDDGVVQAVDPASGQVRGVVQLHERLAFGPRIWGDRLVIGTLDGTLLSMPLKGGELARLGDTP